MLKLTGLNDSSIFVGASSIFRLRPTVPFEGEDATKVEYAGGYIFTLETIQSLIDRIGDAAKFVRLTTRSAKPVHINTKAVSRVRPSLEINGPGTELVVGGQYQHFSEEYETVINLIY